MRRLNLFLAYLAFFHPLALSLTLFLLVYEDQHEIQIGLSLSGRTAFLRPAFACSQSLQIVHSPASPLS